MALTNGFVENAATTPVDARFMLASMVQKTATNSVRLGQLWGGAGDVSGTNGNGSLAINIASGSYWVLSRNSSDGAIIVANSGVASVSLATAPSANSRIDSIYVKHNDSTFGDADSRPFFGVATGQASVSPVAPAVPQGAYQIATVLIPAGATSTNASGVVVSNTYQFTALSGSAIRYRNTTDMRADTNNLPDGTNAYVKGGGSYFLRNGVWNRFDAQPTARVSFNGSLGSSGSTVTLGTNVTSSTTNDGMYFDLSGGAVIRVVYGGTYSVTGNARWQLNANGERYLEVTANDSSFPVTISDRRATATAGDGSVTSVERFAAGDFIKLKGQQNSGSTLTYSGRLTATIVSLD